MVVPSTGNVTGHSQDITAVFQPKTVEQVVEIVVAARRAKTPLYPVSTGFNWGYGSRSPVTPGCALVDLSGMNRILNRDQISSANPVAVIEPGVTQGQLHDFLQAHCPGLTFNITGSGRETSIIGNALDRGVGYLGPRREDLFGLEVVCGSGEVLRTGFRRLGESSPLAHSHPYGLGPMLDGLFFQGNFGIVTSACFKLVPRPERQAAVSLSPKGDLATFIDDLAALKLDGTLTSVTHVGDRARSHATLMRGIVGYLEGRCGIDPAQALREGEQVLSLVAPQEWTSLTSLSGDAGQIGDRLRKIRRRLRGKATVRVVTDARLDAAYRVTDALRFIPAIRRQAAALAAIRPLHALATGEPSDVAIDNLLWKFGRPDLKATDLDRSDCGILYICPALPLRGEMVADVIQGMRGVAADHGHVLYLTVNIETATSLVVIGNLLFDRRHEEETSRAHRCAAALLAYIHARGLEVYRARADMMDDIVKRDPTYWGMVRGLKNSLDPDNLIAPGRYNLA